MANIDPYIEQIRVAEYGEEVRGSIINALVAENNESTQAYDAAITAQNSAQNSAAAAATSAATATQGVSDVNTAVANAISTLAGYDSSAKTSATNAAKSATEAATSAANAKTSEINAKASENLVTSAAAAAKTSETNAKTSETNAKASETLAGNSATAAQTASSNAQQYASNALTSATTASNAQTAASNSASNAAKSAQDAKDYAAQAQAATGIDIATLEKPGLVRPDGETLELLNSTGRIGSPLLKEHINDTVYTDTDNQDGVHGIRIFVDPTTKKRTVQKWNDTDKVWEEQFTDIKMPEDSTITMDDDGTIHAAQIEVDIELSTESENPVQNKVITTEVRGIEKQIVTNLHKIYATDVEPRSGVILTNNYDGTYTLSNVATDSGYFGRGATLLKAGKYKIIGCPKNGSQSTYNIYVAYSGHDLFETGDGLEITLDTETSVRIFITFEKGVNCNGLVFKPMITTDLSATYDDFVPYTGDTGSLNGDLAEIAGTKELISDAWNGSGVKGQYYISDNTLWYCKATNSNRPSESDTANWRKCTVGEELSKTVSFTHMSFNITDANISVNREECEFNDVFARGRLGLAVYGFGDRFKNNNIGTTNFKPSQMFVRTCLITDGKSDGTVVTRGSAQLTIDPGGGMRLLTDTAITTTSYLTFGF